MSEQRVFEEWVRERRESGPSLEADFSADVMRRVREIKAKPTLEEKVVGTVRRFVPERNREVVYFGGSAFVGALRVSVIFYFVSV